MIDEQDIGFKRLMHVDRMQQQYIDRMLILIENPEAKLAWVTMDKTMSCVGMTIINEFHESPKDLETRKVVETTCLTGQTKEQMKGRHIQHRLLLIQAFR